MARKPNRPTRGGSRSGTPNRNAFPSDFGTEGGVDEVNLLPNDEHTTWEPSEEHLDPGEVTSWISGQSDTPDLPDFERTEAKGPRRPPAGLEAERTSHIRTPRRRAADEAKRSYPETPRPGRSVAPTPSPVSKSDRKKKPIAEAPKRRTKRRGPAASKPPTPTPDAAPKKKKKQKKETRKQPALAKKRLPTPEPAPRRRQQPIHAAEPTVRQSNPRHIPTGKRPVVPKRAPPRSKRTAQADEDDSLTVPRPPLSAPPVPTPKPNPNPTPMPAPQRRSSVPRAARSFPPAPRVPRPGDPIGDPGASRVTSSLPGQVVAQKNPLSSHPTSNLPSTSSFDEVMPKLDRIPNDAPTVVRPDLKIAAPVTTGTSTQPVAAFGASFNDEPSQGEPTVALPPPSQRSRPLASSAPPPAEALPGSASYSPPPAAPAPPSPTPKPSPQVAASAARSMPPQAAPNRSSRLPRGAQVYDDDEEDGVSLTHIIYASVGVIGVLMITGAILLGTLALIMY